MASFRKMNHELEELSFNWPQKLSWAAFGSAQGLWAIMQALWAVMQPRVNHKCRPQGMHATLVEPRRPPWALTGGRVTRPAVA